MTDKIVSRSGIAEYATPALTFLVFFTAYAALAWVVCGGDRWWVIDFVDEQNVFFGDDAYRFFLSRSAWLNADLYSYNFVLPAALVLDGTITSLLQGDLLFSRIAHGAVGAGILVLVWASGRRLSIAGEILLPAVTLMACVPRYALMSLSFYGEVWLGFCLCLALWLYLRHQFLLMAFVASWLPLLRPEGIFFLAPVWVAMVARKRWREAAMLIAPGFVYFVYLNIVLPRFSDFMYWRQELRGILEKLVMNRSKWEFVNTYSTLLTVPALLGLLYPPLRRIWPFLAGALIWLVWLQGSVFVGLATFEKRYTYVLLPILVLLWAGFFSWIRQVLQPWLLLRGPGGVLAPLCALAVIVLHLAKMDSIRVAAVTYGWDGVVERVIQGRWSEIYEAYTPDVIAAWYTQTGRIEKMLQQDSGIDKLVIYDSVLYYSLNPEAVPEHVMVGFPSSGYMVFHILLDGQAFIQHPGDRMYSYLEYGEPDFSPDERRALVVDIMPLKNYPYSWKENRYELYMFSYLESFEPKTDLAQRPMIYPSMIQKAYMDWYEPEY